MTYGLNDTCSSLPASTKNDRAVHFTDHLLRGSILFSVAVFFKSRILNSYCSLTPNKDTFQFQMSYLKRIEIGFYFFVQFAFLNVSNF